MTAERHQPNQESSRPRQPNCAWTLAPLSLFSAPLVVAVEQITWQGVGSVEHPTSTGGIRSSGRKVGPARGFARTGVTRLDTDAKPARRSSFQEKGTAAARGAASNGRIRGSAVGHARKDRPIAGA